MLVTATGTKAEAALRDAKEKVLDLLRERSEPLTTAAVVEAVEVGRAKVVKALAGLVDEGRVARSGAGKRGDPHMFAIAS